MVTVNEVSWGEYKEWEGPYYRGRVGYVPPPVATDASRYLGVITATEGGHYDAVNMYDRMILSVGLIQWAEAGQYSVSDMLGKVAERGAGLLDPLVAVMTKARAVFKQNARGKWRFFVNGDEVDTIEEQQKLFLGCDGTHGSWGPDNRVAAKEWAAAVASVFQQPEAQRAQEEFTVPRLRGFATKAAEAELWGPGTPTENTGWAGALRAAYLSFATNLPAMASQQLLWALKGLPDRWSEEGVITILRQLTFGPQITIYPKRYNDIRPVLERSYGVDLPDFAKELQAWHKTLGIDPRSEVPGFMDVREIQTELLALGYDLGPAGVDGRQGGKTTDAIRTFQRLAGLRPDGVVGPATRKALVASWISRH